MTKEEVFSLETLEKGKRRYEKGKVKNIHMVDNMIYGSVYGNDLYKVKLQVEDKTVKRIDCSCLDAQLGKRCRHEAAVIEALESELHHDFDFDLNDNHRSDRIKWALGRMTAKEKENLLYNYIKNDSKESRHMVMFKFAMKKPSEKENYILHKANDVIDSYENYYALIDENDERLFEIVPQYAPIEVVFPFLEEYFKEGYEKETFKLLSQIIQHLLKNSETTFNVFGDKLLNFYVNLSKYIEDEKLLKSTYIELRKALNVAPTYAEKNLIYRKMAYGYLDEIFAKEKIKDTQSFLDLTTSKNIIDAGNTIEVFLVDTLPQKEKETHAYSDLVEKYKFLPSLLLVKVEELTKKKKYADAIELINNSVEKLSKDYNYEVKDDSIYLKLSDLYKEEGEKDLAKSALFKAFKLSPKKETLLRLKDLEDKESYQKDLLANYLDLDSKDALELLFDEGYDGLALKIIDHNFNGKYALILLTKNFDHFKNMDKNVLKEVINAKINEAMESSFAIKFSDLLNYVKLLYRVDNNKEDAIKVLRIWGNKFKTDDKFNELIDKEIQRLEE